MSAAIDRQANGATASIAARGLWGHGVWAAAAWLLAALVTVALPDIVPWGSRNLFAAVLVAVALVCEVLAPRPILPLGARDVAGSEVR